jgi:succinyl-CoA synthetase beta subunit
LLSARLARAALSERGKRAQDAHLTLVEMPGNVAVLTGGAGLGMATLDVLADAGLAAGCFVDGTGGAGEAAVRAKALLVMDRARDPEIRGILVYSTLSATSLGAQVRGILAALQERPPDKPVVVGLTAAAAAEREMKAAEARAAFVAAGYPCYEELDHAVAELARRIGAGS